MKFMFVVGLLIVGTMGAGDGGAQVAQERRGQAPTIKGVAGPVVPPARARKWYERARNVTYLNVDIGLQSQGASNAPGTGATVRDLTLVFQLIYKGAATDDLSAAKVLLQATAGRQESARLNAVAQLDLDADGYQYSYARTDYQTELLEATDGARGPLPLRREVLTFQVPPDDLAQLANGNSLKLKFGTERFTIKSPQLTELRRTLAGGE